MNDFDVVVAPEAVDDLVAIHAYITETESTERADHVRDHVLDVCASLAALPGRGHHPPELARLGVLEYRELHWKPFRVIYEVDDGSVIVHAILDGRRDLQALLRERLLRGGVG
ncbi:MAG: type II toxin-antitoxin system RelE/ParE family toxin [Myxococcales bacterium]|nr:type II toxin-antitoxin system RelE/ParE family toxin [Myxococcales bacterium]MCB9536086.1 type II toxin-antitoxin system RelE/ParE family toxin [Myxococcales bacterium]